MKSARALPAMDLTRRIIDLTRHAGVAECRSSAFRCPSDCCGIVLLRSVSHKSEPARTNSLCTDTRPEPIIERQAADQGSQNEGHHADGRILRQESSQQKS